LFVSAGSRRYNSPIVIIFLMYADWILYAFFIQDR